VNGNVIGLFTGSSTITGRETYAPWGALETGALTTLADTNRLRWKGLVWEGDSTQLYYVRARWYDPVSRRFVSEDPLGVEGGINPYVYAANDPMTGWDPSGLFIEDPTCQILSGNILSCSATLDGVEIDGSPGAGWIDIADWETLLAETSGSDGQISAIDPAVLGNAGGRGAGSSVKPHGKAACGLAIAKAVGAVAEDALSLGAGLGLWKAGLRGAAFVGAWAIESKDLDPVKKLGRIYETANVMGNLTVQGVRFGADKLEAHTLGVDEETHGWEKVWVNVRAFIPVVNSIYAIGDAVTVCRR